MAKKASGGTKAGKNGRKSHSELAFDIEAEALPQEIDDKAFASGGFPYHRKYRRKLYEKELEPLQIELLKLLAWARDKGERIVIVFEGRDGAGKGGTIARFTQHLNPRQARVVADAGEDDVHRVREVRHLVLVEPDGDGLGAAGGERSVAIDDRDHAGRALGLGIVVALGQRPAGQRQGQERGERQRNNRSGKEA